MGCFPGLLLLILGAYCGTILPVWAFWSLAIVLLIVGFAGILVTSANPVAYIFFAVCGELSSWFLLGMMFASLVGAYDTGITFEFTPRNWNEEAQ